MEAVLHSPTHAESSTHLCFRDCRFVSFAALRWCCTQPQITAVINVGKGTGNADIRIAHRLEASTLERPTESILDTILNKILSPSSVELAIDEIQNNRTDVNQIDQEIGRVKNLLVSTERSITRLVSLAEETGDIKDIAKRLK